MARVAPEERDHWVAVAEAEAAVFLEDQAMAVAARLRKRARSKAVALDWWEDDGEDWDAELSRRLTGPLSGAMGAGGSALLPGWAPDDADVDALAKSQAGMVNGTTRDRFAFLVDDAPDDEEAAVLVEAEGRKRHRGAAIAVTSVVHAVSSGMIRAAEESGVRASKSWFVSAGHLDADMCDDLAGMSVALDETFDGFSGPPAHVNCGCGMDILLEEVPKRLTPGEYRGLALLRLGVPHSGWPVT